MTLSWLSVVTLTFIVIGTSNSQHLVNLTEFDDWIPDFSKISSLEDVGEMLGHWGFDLTLKCSKNHVKIIVQYEYAKAYECLERPWMDEKPLDVYVSLMHDDAKKNPMPSLKKICSHLDLTLECLEPILAKVERCFDSESFPMEDVINEMLGNWLRQMCKPDKYYEKAMANSGEALAECMRNYADAILVDTAECFDRRSVKTIGARGGTEAICSDFDTYQDCFIDALEICDNEQVEKLMFRMLERPTYKKLLQKFIFKCKNIQADP